MTPQGLQTAICSFSGWYLIVDSIRAKTLTSKSPTYSTHQGTPFGPPKGIEPSRTRITPSHTSDNLRCLRCCLKPSEEILLIYKNKSTISIVFENRFHSKFPPQVLAHYRIWNQDQGPQRRKKFLWKPNS